MSVAEVRVKSDKPEDLKAAFEIAFRRHEKATHWMVTPQGWLALCWIAENGAQPLPYGMNVEKAISFVSGWLEEADYGRAPDTDGSAVRGFEVDNDSGSFRAIVAVKPTWIIYGK